MLPFLDSIRIWFTLLGLHRRPVGRLPPEAVPADEPLLQGAGIHSHPPARDLLRLHLRLLHS